MADGLDPEDWSALAALGHRMLDDMIGALRTIRDEPVWRPMPDAVRAALAERRLPQAGRDPAALYAELQALVLPYGTGNRHPRFMGWVHGGGTGVGMLAEMLAAGLNSNLGGRDHAPIELERQVIATAAAMIGMPAGSSGLLVTGSSMANFIAVLVASRHHGGRDIRRTGVGGTGLVGYAAGTAHGCIPRAFDMAGLGTDALRLIPVDAAHRIDLAALATAIAADRARGLAPFMLVGNAGTVDCGAIDDLDGLAAIAGRERLWFHVDGAFGALAVVSPRHRNKLRGIERADSLAFDFHKWAQVPYDAGCVLVRDAAAQAATFAQTLAYLFREERGLGANAPWPCDLGPDLSRGFRALKVWMTLQAYGADGLAGVVDRCCAVAAHLAARVEREPALELLAPVTRNIVCFRARAAAAAGGGRRGAGGRRRRRAEHRAGRRPAGKRHRRAFDDHARRRARDPRRDRQPSHHRARRRHPRRRAARAAPSPPSRPLASRRARPEGSGRLQVRHLSHPFRLPRPGAGSTLRRPNEWQRAPMVLHDASVLMTAFDTLVYLDEERNELRHGDVSQAPRNLFVEAPGEAAGLVVQDGAGAHRALDEYAAELLGQYDRYAIRHGDRFATARPDGTVEFSSGRVRSWETLTLRAASRLDSRRFWRPERPQGGTELVANGLRAHLGDELDRINLHTNDFEGRPNNGKPSVVWFHNEPGPMYEWCREERLLAEVDRFVFVSNTQMVRICATYPLIPRARCRVIRNAIHVPQAVRPWPSHSAWRWKCAYVSAPYRGLHTLIQAWRLVQPQNAELHVFSGITLWGRSDEEYRELFAKVIETDNVTYHGVASNDVIRDVLRDVHFLLYPARFDETSCISVIEAMSFGLRVIAPSRGALGETSGGFARIYPDVDDEDAHVELFASVLAEELRSPWLGREDLAIAGQQYCRELYDWSGRAREWRHLIGELAIGG